MITTECRKEVYERAGGCCENPNCPNGKNAKPIHFYLNGNWELHHIYFRSQYRGLDRDQAWNLALLCISCHRCKIGKEINGVIYTFLGVHMGNKSLDKRLKKMADIRKPVDERDAFKYRFIKRSSKIQKKCKDWEVQKKRRLERDRRSRKKSLKKFKGYHGGLSPMQVQYKLGKAYKKSLKNG